jgi:hypothetical protein
VDRFNGVNAWQLAPCLVPASDWTDIPDLKRSFTLAAADEVGVLFKAAFIAQSTGNGSFRLVVDGAVNPAGQTSTSGIAFGGGDSGELQFIGWDFVTDELAAGKHTAKVQFRPPSGITGICFLQRSMIVLLKR